MSQALTLRAEDVAALLNVTVATLPAKWRRLHKEAGFPAPLPRCPNLWSRSQVEAWLDDPTEAPAPKTKKIDARITRDRDALTAKYAGVAA